MDVQLQNHQDFLNPPFKTNVPIPYVYIKSPLKEYHLENTSYLELQGVVSEQIQNMIESQHFRSDKDITVKMGIESLEDPMKGRHDVTYKKKQDDVKLINQIVDGYNNANTIQEIDQVVNQSVLADRKQNVDIRIYPHILIEGTRKKGFYAKMNQEFSDKGFASFGATIGYWNPFKLNDKIQVEYEGGVNEKVWKKFNYHNYVVKWMIPKAKNTIQLEGAYSFSWTAQGLYEGIYHFSPKLITRKYQVGLELAKRSVLIDTKSEGDLGYFSRNYMQPSRKISIKFTKDLTDTFTQNSDGIPDGETSNVHIEGTVPFASQAQFIKLDYNIRKYFDLYQLSRNLKNSVMKKALQNSTLEIASTLNATLKKTHFVSDYLRPLSLRGFETSDMPNESLVNFKTSVKWNIHNFPILKIARVRAFVYYQAGLSFQRKNLSKMIPSLRSSGGWGVSFPLNNAAHLEIIYNLFQQQSNSTARPTNFQVRIGFND